MRKIYSRHNGWDSDVITVGELKRILENAPDDACVIIGEDVDNCDDYISQVHVSENAVGLFTGMKTWYDVIGIQDNAIMQTMYGVKCIRLTEEDAGDMFCAIEIENTTVGELNMYVRREYESHSSDIDGSETVRVFEVSLFGMSGEKVLVYLPSSWQ